MNRNIPSKPQPRVLCAALAMLLSMGTAHAALTDIGSTPVASGPSGVVKPNVSFVLDTSGSMAWSHAPDESKPFSDAYGYKTSQCNSIYYNPSINYVAPKKSDNTSFANMSFTAALYDGYDSGSGTANLSTSFRAFDNTTSSNAGTDSAQAAYYYVYSGTATSQNPAGGTNYTVTSSTFYKECNSAIGSTPGKSVFTLVKVTSSSGPGSTDERTNFANWYSFYRTRMLMMKSAAGRAFSTIGPTYRIGFMTIYATPSNSTSDSDYLKIADYDQPQKDAWYKRFYDQSPSGNTPLKSALSTAGRNYAGVLGPDPVQYSCQQNFTILTTDGYWNDGTANGVKINGSSSVGNQDNVEADTPSPEYDGGLSGSKDTLADVAAYYYRTDLRPTGGTCNTGVAGADVCEDNVPTKVGLDENPKQHMTTFTVGLGVNGQLAYADNYLTGGSVDYNAVKQGTKDWPSPKGDTLTTIDDLWHAAVNGHGQYFSAKNPDNLVTGLRTALAGVSARDAAGAAAATSNLEPIAGDNFAYVANYRTQKWDGDVQARLIDLTTGAISDTAVWSTQEQLDTQVADVSDTRTIFTFLSNAKVSFAPASFSAAQKTAWFTPANSPALSQYAGWSALQKTTATADTVITFLRGQWGYDQRPANTLKLYRFREHALGDIVNGRPAYSKKSPFDYKENSHSTYKTATASRAGVVYAAANDGMLHAIAATTGKEIWAYVPSFVLPNLKALADESYAHQFYVDGSPTVSDVWNGSAWKTILVGGLNAGGKGYYALDVTDPNSPSVLWEFTDATMGYTFGNPIISKLEDDTWNVFVTTGYNNADGIGRLHVLNALTGAIKFTLATTGGTAATPSGLAKISAYVDDGQTDNTAMRLYGGDLLGNLWRFDVNGTIPPAGKEASRLALLKAGTYLQPITTKPELGLVAIPGTLPQVTVPVVFVGTGKYLGPSDVTDVGQQSLYAIRDDLTAAGVGDLRTAPVAPCTFVKQTLNIVDVNTRSTSTTPVDWTAKCGWYLDFNPSNSTPGERTSIDPRLQLGVLALATNIPEKSICSVGGTSFLYFFNYTTGTYLVSTTGSSPAGTRIGNALAVGLNVYRLPNGKVVATTTMSDDSHVTKGQPDGIIPSGGGRRVLWRELIN